jgi:hypothetical protein
MTSVPLGFWPDNLSSLGFVIVGIALLIGSWQDNEQFVVWLSILGIGIFVADQLILGPLWFYIIDHKK